MAFLIPTQVQPLGDTAFLLRFESELLTQQAYRTLLAQNLIWVKDTVLAYSTIGVHIETKRISLTNAMQILREIDSPSAIENTPPVTHSIPVCYELGEDILAVAQQRSLTPDDVKRLHSGKVYQIYAMGFCPGFPYLGYLPDELCGVPRLATPRTRIEPGSVGLTGRQTGIYPLVRPGGWPLIGKTPLELVNIEEGYFPLNTGDQAQFVPITPEEYHARKGERLGEDS